MDKSADVDIEEVAVLVLFPLLESVVEAETVAVLLKLPEALLSSVPLK